MLLRSATVRDLDRLTARVFDSPARHSGCKLNAYRIDDQYFIDIDLPGVDPAGIDITVDRKVLTVRAERKRRESENVQTVGAEHEDGEQADGLVSRQVQLSDSLDTDRLEAGYDNGVLTLSIPVAELSKPRQIEVAAK